MTLTTYSASGQGIKDLINTHLNSESARALKLENFFRDRIRIKTLEENIIVPLIAKVYSLFIKEKKKKL